MDNVQIFLREHPEGATSIQLNRALREHDVDPRPIAFLVRLTFANAAAEPWGTQDEIERVHAATDATTPLLKRVKGKRVAEERGRGGWVGLWYVSEVPPQDVVSAVRDLWAPLGGKLIARQDPSWDLFERMVPTPTERHTAKSMELIAQLTAHADQLQTPRPVDFSAFFRIRTGADAYVQRAVALGFTHEETRRTRDGDAWFVLLRRTMPVHDPVALGKLGAALEAAAEENKGQYDGWGCPVVK